MRIAVVGGTGTLGRQVTCELSRRGHEVRVLSRSSAQFPIDLESGQGLASALAGCGAVVDTSSSARRARQVMVEGSARLLAAEQQAGVGHHVRISIVGCDQASLSIYRVQVDQEKVVAQGPVPWTIVRATQFHELVDLIFAATARTRVLPAATFPMQPVAAADVARVLADTVESDPRGNRITVAGPQLTSLRELARSWLTVTGRSAVLLPVPVPGNLGRALRSGSLTASDADVTGTITFADWLAGPEHIFDSPS